MIINEQGQILTAMHVVRNASEIKVTFADGTESLAQVVSSDPQHDIAVLEAEIARVKAHKEAAGTFKASAEALFRKG